MSNEAKLGIFFLVGILLLGVLFELLGGVSIFEKHYTLHTSFNYIGELKVGNPVKIEGLEVGRVTALSIEQGRIKVEMDIEKDKVIKQDSLAEIRLTSLLGISYMNITFGSPESPPAQDGTVLPSEDYADINIIMKDLEGTVANLDTVIARISSGEGTIGLLLNDEELYRNATGAARNLNEILQRINDGEGTIGKLVYDDTLYMDAKNAASKLERAIDTQEDMAPLNTLATAFGIFTVF